MLTARSELTTDRTLAQSRPASVGHQTAWAQAFTDAGSIDVTICIANWNCRDLLRTCLESLHDLPQGVRLETIVVDNASTDGAAEMVARDFPEVILVRNASNVGFSKANNQAARRAKGRYLFFSNNDTEVPAGSLRKLVVFADANPTAGMIGPRLRDPRGRLQISYRRGPTVAALLHRTSVFRWTGLLRTAYRHYRRLNFDPSVRRNVDVLMGAAVLMPRDVFFGCGGWDEGFVFGGEDIDLSLRVNREHEVVYFPDVELTHHGRVSSRQNVTFSEPNVAIGYVRSLRTAGASSSGILAYKCTVTFDAPAMWLAKCVQYGWRRMCGRAEKAEKSRLAAQGLWHFLTRGLGRFWRDA